VTTDFCKVWGDAIVKTKIGLSFSEPTASISLISPDNYREFIAPYHKELVSISRPRRWPDHPHLWHDLSDLRGHHWLRLQPRCPFDLDQQADPKLHVDHSSASWRWPRSRGGIGNVDATRFEKSTKE